MSTRPNRSCSSPRPSTEDPAGYAKLLERLGAPTDTLVLMEATGPYWQNLFARLVAEGFALARVNPLRTARFAEEELQRTKTDAIDALGSPASRRRSVRRSPPCLRYDGRHHVGTELARALIDAGQASVGAHHGHAYRLQVRMLCDDIDLLRERLRELGGEIRRLLEAHEVGRLLTTINGIGPGNYPFAV